jgi:hypothetical protein
LRADVDAARRIVRRAQSMGVVAAINAMKPMAT